MSHTLSGTSPRPTRTTSVPQSRFRGPSFSTVKTQSGHRTHHPSRVGFSQAAQAQTGERLGALALTWAWLMVVPIDLILWGLSLNEGLDVRLANPLMLLAALLGALL